MKKLLLATTVVLTLAAPPAMASIISDLGTDPTSATGNFIRSLLGVTVPFDDQFTFNLDIGTFFTIAGVQNSFAQPSDFISNFGAKVYNYGANGVFEGNLPGHGDDVAVIIGGAPVPCQFNPACQVIAGSAFLPNGLYYADISGTGGGTSGYQGGVAVAAVPGPLAGAGIPGLLAACVGLWGFAMRRRKRRNGVVA
jgi:hypothetical protein